MPNSAELWETLCRIGGLIRLLLSALTASLYQRIAHVLKPPDVRTNGVTTFLKPVLKPVGLGQCYERLILKDTLL